MKKSETKSKTKKVASKTPPVDNSKPGPNREQAEAIAYGDGPLLIIAGAGTGKTSVITQRIAHLILDKGVKSNEVLALTFTEKAAHEMEERVDALMPYGYVDLWISTFHSFCEKVLRQHGIDIGISTDFKLITQTDAWVLVRQHLDLFQLDYYRPRGNPTKFIHALLSHFGKCKDEMVYPNDYSSFANEQMPARPSGGSKIANEQENIESRNQEINRVKEVAKAYEVYQNILHKENYLDFGDLINLTLELFRKRPLIAKIYQQQFKYILVDEFQDTNYAQYELVKILAKHHNNITVVGDDDQSIYRFRGASMSNILNFVKDYPKAHRIVLSTNYRSKQQILDAAYSFIQLNNPHRLEVAVSEFGEKISKKLQSPLKEKGVVAHLSYQTSQDEVIGVVSQIEELHTKNKDSHGNYAILVRSHDSAVPFISELKRKGIPYVYTSIKGLYTKPLIIDVLSYFKLLDNYHESGALYRVLVSSFVDLTHHDVMILLSYANKKTLSLYETIKRMSDVAGLSKDAQEKISKLLNLIDSHSQLTKERSALEVFLVFMKESGLLKKFLKLESETDKISLELLQSLFNRIKKFDESVHDASLKNFMHEMDLELESGELGSIAVTEQKDVDAVQIMTIHASKGLEFETVFIVGVVDKRFPSIERSDPIEIPQALIKDVVDNEDHHLQEERRLMYVAMTRAKTNLFFTTAKDYGGAREKKISRFLVELSEQYPEFAINNDCVGSLELATNLTLHIQEHSHQEKFVYTPPAHYSFTQLMAFSKCPYQYKLGFIYKIPQIGKPVFSYGRTMHKTLEEFYKLVASQMMQGQVDLFSALENKVGASKISELVTFENMKALYEHSWIDDWYTTKKDKEEYYAKGLQGLERVYNNVKDQEPQTLYLEKPFTLKLQGTKGEEYSLRGVIDRIDKRDGAWHIIDYKTGTSKDKLDADAKMQLLIYQVAAQELWQARVGSLTYLYLDDAKELTFLGDDDELQALKIKLVSLIESIRDSAFTATPGWQCEFCDFRDICDFRE
ncbi:ATP-dependent helicase [Candidatus Falkowbacteria bacterium]|nr:ATP-dependent helicase [Candidatus Falkowbacteria bacterium]